MVYGADFNAVDIGAIIIILMELLLGLRRGLSGTLFRLLGTVVVLLAGLRFYRSFGDLLVQHTTRLSENPEMAGALAFLLIVIGLGLCFLVLRVLLGLLMTITFNEKINRAGGGIVGVVHGMALVLLIVYAVGLWPQAALHQLFVQESLVGRTVFKYSPDVVATINGAWRAIHPVPFRGVNAPPLPEKQ